MFSEDKCELFQISSVRCSASQPIKYEDSIIQRDSLSMSLHVSPLSACINMSVNTKCQSMQNVEYFQYIIIGEHLGWSVLDVPDLTLWCLMCKSCHAEWLECWDLSEHDLVWTVMGGTVHHCSQPRYCNAKWHTHSDSVQHLAWPYVSLYLCNHVCVRLFFLYICKSKIYNMSLTSMLIIIINP